jgi:hypothetical protein
MIIIDILLSQIIVKQVEQQVRLTAPSYSGNDFSHPVMLFSYKFIQINRSIHLSISREYFFVLSEKYSLVYYLDMAPKASPSEYFAAFAEENSLEDGWSPIKTSYLPR